MEHNVLSVLSVVSTRGAARVVSFPDLVEPLFHQSAVGPGSCIC